MSGVKTVVKCPECGAKNRAAFERIRTAVCGKCGSGLAEAVRPLMITDANFSSTAGSPDFPVLLDLWADWCGPCRMVAPVIEKLAAELAGKVLVGKLDVDSNPSTSARFGVQSIPTLLILKAGREVDRLIGVQSREAILSRLEPLID